MENHSEVELLKGLNEKYQTLKSEIAKVIVGQDKVVENVLLSIFGGGHCLLVGVPGLAKTLTVSTLAKVLGLKYSRIQFTPDLMPSDITGTEILDESRKFKFIHGPIFGNVILADEINRTPPKTQAALLEAMQEKSVTISNETHRLPAPFFVLATQNPIEQEGTYPLPEAQLDRFMFNIKLDYPTFDEEIQILKTTTRPQNQELNVVLSATEIETYQNIIRNIPVADNVYEYIVRLVTSTRNNIPSANPLAKKYISWGAGPRASQYLVIGAKTHAALHGKFSPDIENVKAIAKEVLRHRVVLNYSAESEGVTVDGLIDELLKNN